MIERFQVKVDDVFFTFTGTPPSVGDYIETDAEDRGCRCLLRVTSIVHHFGCETASVVHDFKRVVVNCSYVDEVMP